MECHRLVKFLRAPVVILPWIAVACFAQGSIGIDFAAVDSGGNAADSRTNLGSVSYDYWIGTYEVTNAQYVAFLNAKAQDDSHGLYNEALASGGIQRSGSSGSYTYQLTAGWENKPISLVSFTDAMRFCNWLTNGQGSGDTETGVYNLQIGAPTRIGTALTSGGFAIATIDEWYKAAYFDPTLNSGAGGYWLYPTQSNAMPSYSDIESTNGANYSPYTKQPATMADLMDVGVYINSGSYYGTFDQGGNVWEWVESPGDGYTSTEHFRGGGINYDYDRMKASFGITTLTPETEAFYLGFRLVTLTAPAASAVPEPADFGVGAGLLAGAIAVFTRRRRRASDTDLRAETE